MTEIQTLTGKELPELFAWTGQPSGMLILVLRMMKGYCMHMKLHFL